MVLKWGIVSVGTISHDFVTALSLSFHDHKIVAVAAKNKEKAKEFAKKFNIPKFHDNFKKLAEDGNVDIVFIGVIHSEHLRVARMMMTAGKNVLCKNPLALNYLQTNKMIQIAHQQHVFLMEATGSRCTPIYEKLQQELKNNTIGEVREVIINVGMKMNPERYKQKILGGGGMLDVGTHGLQFITLVFGNIEPTEIKVTGSMNSDGADDYVNVFMKFGTQGVSTFTYSVISELDNFATVIGTKGTIKIMSPFWAPTKMIMNGIPFELPLPKSNHPFKLLNSAALMYEADHVKECLDKGQLESPLVSQSESITWAKLRDEIRRQLGMKYKEEE